MMDEQSIVRHALLVAGGMAVIALLILIDVLGSIYEGGGF